MVIEHLLTVAMVPYEPLLTVAMVVVEVVVIVTE